MASHVVFITSAVEFAGTVMAPPMALPTSVVVGLDALASWLYLANLTLNLSGMFLSSWIADATIFACSTAQTLVRSEVWTKAL